MDVREAFRRVPARQEASELALDVLRKRAGVVVACVLEEVFEVLLDQTFMWLKWAAARSARLRQRV
jgi:hypothetical protein